MGHELVVFLQQRHPVTVPGLHLAEPAVVVTAAVLAGQHGGHHCVDIHRFILTRSRAAPARPGQASNFDQAVAADALEDYRRSY